MGNKGVHLDKRDDINVPATPPPPGFTGTLQSRRPFPDFGFIFDTDMRGDAYYHSLQLTVKRSAGRGLAFLGDYTFSKALDTSNFPGHDRIYIPGESLCPVAIPPGPFTILADPAPLWLALPGLLAVTVLVLILAGLQLRRIEINYTSD